MTSLAERYPQAHRLPLSDTQADDRELLKQLEPYLGWMLAEIDTGTTDILLSDANSTTDSKAHHLVLLSGRAVSLWLRHQHSGEGDDRVSSSDNEHPALT